MSILRTSQLSSGSYSISGSFSGSFQGDGSNVTGITAEWDGSYLGDASITGSLTLSGSNVDLNVLGNISASAISSSTYYGDGSNLTGITATTSSYALTASYVETSQTASYIISSSIDGITDYVRIDQTSSLSVATASYVETAQTASYVLNAVSSSFASTAISASYAVSASHEIIKEISSSHADTASFAQSGDGIFSGSFSGSYVGDGSGLTGIIHTSASYASTASYVETAQTASYVLNAVSSSYATTSSYAITAQTLLGSVVSASYALTASYVETSQTASYVLNAVSSSYSTTASYVNPLTQDVDITGQTDITGNVLVTGSLTVSGSNSIVNLQEIQFDTEHSQSGHTTGRMYWDDNDKTVTLDMQGSDVRLQVGQEEHVYAFNNSGVAINNGDAVRISGAVGGNVTIELAVSSVKSFKGSTEQDQILGLATENIADNKSGYITTFGQVRGLDTTTFTGGDILFLSNTTSGSYSNTSPPSPYFQARIGIVEVVNALEGTILVRPGEPTFLTDIAQITSSGVIPNDKSYLCYDDNTDLINFTNELSGSFSGSFQGDGSGLTGILHTSASYAATASYVETSQTASYVISSSIDGITNYVNNNQTSSMAVATASYVETAQTASYVLNSISSSYSTFAVSASYAVSASHEIIKEVSSSYADTASFAQSGNGIFSGSFSGSYVGDGSGLTGILHTSASYALTASYVETSQTASYVISSSIDGITNYVRNDQTSSMTVLSSSFAISSSHSETTDFILGGNVFGPVADAVDAVSSSYASTASYVETAQTASYVLNAVSSSYSTTASYVETAQTASYVLNAISSSYATTASFAQSGDGIFSGSFSGSFVGDGSGLTGLPTATNVLRNVTSTDTFSTAGETINCTSGTFIVNLPTAIGAQGVEYTLVNNGTGIITMKGSLGQTINGSTTIDLKRQYISRTVQSDNANWIII